MHKFFCSFNTLTQKYELTKISNSFGRFIGSKIYSQSENTLLGEIKNDLQELYYSIVLIKENEKDDKSLNILDETELLISNLYFSFFASPLELPPEDRKSTATEINKAFEIISKLEKEINIPEYNRLTTIIKNNIFILLK